MQAWSGVVRSMLVHYSIGMRHGNTRRAATVSILPAVAALAAVSTGASVAVAQGRAYRGPHPVDLEGHWHLEDAVHVHDELPVGVEPFGDVDGVFVFLADPVAYGYEGRSWTYRGVHPLPGGLSAYCGIEGEHRHPFAPDGSFRREAGGAYTFTGALRGGRRMVRPGVVAPRHPIVTRPSAAGNEGPPVVTGTFFHGGCLHAWTVGADGRSVAVPVDGCVPAVRSGVARPPSVLPPPDPRIEQPYTRTFTGPAQLGRRLDRAPQRGANRPPTRPRSDR